ncbi:hypothetical protein SCA6_011956, partial [Theobroma cacao]
VTDNSLSYLRWGRWLTLRPTIEVLEYIKSSAVSAS